MKGDQFDARRWDLCLRCLRIRVDEAVAEMDGFEIDDDKAASPAPDPAAERLLGRVASFASGRKWCNGLAILQLAGRLSSSYTYMTLAPHKVCEGCRFALEHLVLKDDQNEQKGRN